MSTWDNEKKRAYARWYYKKNKARIKFNRMFKLREGEKND